MRFVKDIAGDAATPPSQLAELSRSGDAEIRLLVASNPNTPIDTLMKLGEEFPDAIVDNPVFDLLKLEDPKSYFVRLCLARSTKTDPNILTKLALGEDKNEAICLAAAKNPSTPVGTLKQLIDLAWKEWRESENELFITVAKEVIRNPSMTVSCLEEILDKYIDRHWNELLWEFCDLPNVSLQMIENIAVKHGARCLFMDGTDSLLIDMPIVQQSSHILDVIARYSCEESVIIKIINNPLTLDSTLNYLATSEYKEVRDALMCRPGIPEEALSTMLGNIDISKYDF